MKVLGPSLFIYFFFVFSPQVNHRKNAASQTSRYHHEKNNLFSAIQFFVRPKEKFKWRGPFVWRRVRWRFSVLSSSNQGQHDHHVLQTPLHGLYLSVSPPQPNPNSSFPNPHFPNSQLSPPNSLPSRPLLSNPSPSWPPPRSANPHHHGRVLLILQFSLDKLYFTPLGNFMDEKDTAIREKLDEGGKKLKVEAELQEALISLEQQKEETIKVLDSQIAALCQDIVKKVLPTA